MIYDKNGNALEYVFDQNGNALEIAYDGSGRIVYESGSDPYAYYSIASIYSKTRNNAQGMDIYGNYMAIYDGTTYDVKLINMTTWQIEYTLTTDVSSHGNDISFSSRFYDSGDEFPLLFINGSRNAGLRINLSNSTATTVVTINAVPSGETWVSYGEAFNDNMTRLYKMGYNTNNYQDSSGFIFLETWDISESLENPTRISTLIREWFPCIQGVAYHDGLLWVASGLNDPVKVYAINPVDASIVKTVDLTRTGELEGIGWGYDNSTGKWFCVYGQIYNGITYYRIDFSSVPIN